MSGNDVLAAELKTEISISAERPEREGDKCPGSAESQLAGEQPSSTVQIASSVDATTSEPANETQSRVDEANSESISENAGSADKPGEWTTKPPGPADDSAEKTSLFVRPNEHCGDFLKKRAAGNDSCVDDTNDSSLDGGTFKKTKLFGSAMNDPEDKGEGNYFSRALNRLASQSNIQIRPLSSQKSDTAESDAMADDDSRMSWTTETTSNKQLFCSGDNAYTRSHDVNRLYEPETGEEDEVTILEVHSRLYMFSSESGTWKERGRGMLKLNDKFDSSPDFTAPVSRLELVLTMPQRKERLSSSSPSKASPEDCDRIMYELQWRIDEQTAQTTAEALSSSAAPATTSPRLPQTVFAKPCMLKQNQAYLNVDGFKFILTYEKTLKDVGGGDDSSSSELKPHKSNEVIFKRGLKDVQSIKDMGDCQVDISFSAGDVFRLQFSDRADADDVRSILKSQVTTDPKDMSTRSDSSEGSSSSSYKSACSFSDVTASSMENKDDTPQPP